MDSDHELDASILEAITNVQDYYRNPDIIDVNKKIALCEEDFRLSLVLDGAARKNREYRGAGQYPSKIKPFNLKRCIIKKLQRSAAAAARPQRESVVTFNEPEKKNICPRLLPCLNKKKET